MKKRQDKKKSREIVKKGDDFISDLITTPILKKSELEYLYTPQELSKLKMEILTGVDPKAKVEAIRKLIYSPLPPDEKIMFFIKGLSDESDDVRKESSLALKTIGISNDICNALWLLSEVSPSQKNIAIDKLVNLKEKAPVRDKTIILAAFLFQIKLVQDSQILVNLISTLSYFMDVISENEDLFVDICKTCITKLTLNPLILFDPIRNFFIKASSINKKQLSKLLLEEESLLKDKKLRSYILVILTQIETMDEYKSEVASRALELICDWSENDVDCRRLVISIERLGDVIIQECIKRYDKLQDAQKILLIRLLDGVVRREDRTINFNELGEFVLNILRTSTRPVRISLMETQLIYVPRYNSNLKMKLAEELLSRIQEYKLGRYFELTEIILKKLGFEIVDVLLRRMKQSYYDFEKEISARIIGDCVIALKEKKQVYETKLNYIVNETMRMIEDGFVKSAELTKSLGKICTSQLCLKENIVRVADFFLKNLERYNFKFEILTTLGNITSGENTPLDIKMNIGMLFLKYIDAELPDEISQDIRTSGGTYLNIKKEATAYIDLIPILIDGIKKICFAEDITENFREKLVEHLIKKWYEIVTYKIIWGPATTSFLAESLGEISSLKLLPLHLKMKILSALNSKIINTSVIDIISKSLSLQEDDKIVDEFVERYVKEVLQLSQQSGYREYDDRVVICKALGRVGLRKRLSVNKDESEILRTRIVDFIILNFEEMYPETKNLLRKYLESVDIPKELKEKISNRTRIDI